MRLADEPGGIEWCELLKLPPFWIDDSHWKIPTGHWARSVPLFELDICALDSTTI